MHIYFCHLDHFVQQYYLNRTFQRFSKSPIWAPAWIALRQIFMTGSLLDQQIDLFFDVLLVLRDEFILMLHLSNSRRVSSISLRFNGIRLKEASSRTKSQLSLWKFSSTKLVIDSLDDNFGSLIEFFLHDFFLLLVFHDLSHVNFFIFLS